SASVARATRHVVAAVASSSLLRHGNVRRKKRTQRTQLIFVLRQTSRLVSMVPALSIKKDGGLLLVELPRREACRRAAAAELRLRRAGFDQPCLDKHFRN